MPRMGSFHIFFADRQTLASNLHYPIRGEKPDEPAHANQPNAIQRFVRRTEIRNPLRDVRGVGEAEIRNLDGV